METEKHKNQREIHEREVALQIARLQERKRLRAEAYWEKWRLSQEHVDNPPEI